MDLFYILMILLLATRVFGEIAEHLGQPALVGVYVFPKGGRLGEILGWKACARQP